MKKHVKDLVNKEWASSARQILTSSAPDVSTLRTALLTITKDEAENVKTDAAQQRLRAGAAALMEGVSYGWAFGLAGKELPGFTKPVGTHHRRIKALMPIAIEAGRQIGASQLAKINKAHGIPEPGQFSHTRAR